MIRFRPASADDVPAVVALLADDVLGATREGQEAGVYLAAFTRMLGEGNSHLIVGEETGRIIATYQITYITGLSMRATRRAQVESVRVAADLRGRGIGAKLMHDAEARARKAGCSLIQLTTHRSRHETHRFYERLGFTPSHIGYKRDLN